MSDIYATRRAGGFSLIELMIAVAIGLALTIVVAQLFLGSRQTYATTDDVSRMQENIRFTYQLLSRTTHLAGYRSSPNVVTTAIFDPLTNPVITGTDPGGAIPDTFTIRYQGHSNGTGPIDNTVVDCLGTPVAAGVMAVNTFFIAPGRNGRNALWCTTAPDGTGGLEIVADVENMQVLYGVSIAENGFSVEQYVAAGAVVPDNVRSVRVALLFETAHTGVAPALDNNVYTLIPAGAPGGAVTRTGFNDTRIRRVVTMTLSLRNRTP